MKIDGSKGWISTSSLNVQPKLKDFVRVSVPQMQPLEFLEEFRSVPYLWGGISKAGIDCSGLTQDYFLRVHDKIIPRNSREQRRLGPEKTLDEAKDHDLVFGVGRIGGSHHVGLYLEANIWHAYSDEGVVCHTVDRFCELFRVEAVVSVLQNL
jgi:hypothetical protein